MSGIEGCYFADDWGFQYYPGKVFSSPDREDDEPGYYVDRDPEEVELEREFWQEVSKELQELGLGAFQARKKIYELEERMMCASPEVIEIIYHYSPKRIAKGLIEFNNE